MLRCLSCVPLGVPFCLRRGTALVSRQLVLVGHRSLRAGADVPFPDDDGSPLPVGTSTVVLSAHDLVADLLASHGCALDGDELDPAHNRRNPICKTVGDGEHGSDVFFDALDDIFYDALDDPPHS